MESNVTSPLTKGLIIGLILVVLGIIAYFTGQDQASWNKWLTNIVLFGGIIWACMSYGKQMNNNVTFGNVFGHGFKVTAVITCITLLFTVIFMLIFPEIKEKGLEVARTEMEKKGQLTEDQINSALDLTRRMFYIFVIGGIIVLYLIIGAIASLVGAALTKKQPATPFENQL